MKICDHIAFVLLWLVACALLSFCECVPNRCNCEACELLASASEAQIEPCWSLIDLDPCGNDCCAVVAPVRIPRPSSVNCQFFRKNVARAARMFFGGGGSVAVAHYFQPDFLPLGTMSPTQFFARLCLLLI